jgi:hypothetical protein
LSGRIPRAAGGQHLDSPRGDREDILAQYDAKTLAMSEMKRLLAETRTIVLSEDLVEP